MSSGRRPVVALVVALVAAASVGCAFRQPVEFVDAGRRCAADVGERASSALVACAERSVVYVQTPEASGTGIVVEREARNYVVTNSHVVDPWGGATIMVAGKQYDEVPVVGAMVGDDIAVVGPLPKGADVRAIDLAVGADPKQGDELYLVGYPGEPEPDRPGDLHATITRGILSGTRAVKEFDQTYLQTDAAIAGGQSGGPLFSARGEVLGISGLSFADRFALALSAPDVQASVERIMDGKGDAAPRIPPSEGGAGADSMVTDGRIGFTDAGDRQLLVLPAASVERTFRFEITPAENILVAMWSDVGFEPLALSSNSDDIDDQLATLAGDDSGDDFFGDIGIEDPGFEDPEFEDPEFEDPEFEDPEFDDPGLDDGSEFEDPTEAEVEPGTFEVDVAADETVYIEVSAPLTEGATAVDFHSALPVYQLTAARSVADVDVGTAVDSVLTRFGTGSDFLLQLNPGQKVRIRATSAQSDVAFLVFEDDAVPGPVESSELPDGAAVETYDDGGGGLYGMDAEGFLESTDGGVYRIRVYSNDFVTVLGRLSVTDCRTIDCDP